MFKRIKGTEEFLVTVFDKEALKAVFWNIFDMFPMASLKEMPDMMPEEDAIRFINDNRDAFDKFVFG